MSIKLLRYAFVIVACIIHAWFVEAVGLNKLSVKISLHSYEILLWVWPIWGVVLWLCWKNVWAVAIPVIVGLIFIGPCYFGWMFGHSDSSFGLMPNKSPEPTPIAASGHSITPVVLIVSGSGWLSFFRQTTDAAMKPSDYLGFGVFFSLGLLLLLFPRSVIRFYTWFHRGRVKMPGTFGVRLSGGLWVIVVCAVLISFLMKR